MEYKAIETLYAGYKFRSRLEARWAVFFDALGLEYQYEPEGFELDGMRYLPDFYLPIQGIWIEVKPSTMTWEEREKAIRLCLMAQCGVMALEGNIWPGEYRQIFFHPTLMTQEHLFTLIQTCEGNAIHWFSQQECILNAFDEHAFGFDLHRGYAWWHAFDWNECPLCGTIAFHLFHCHCPEGSEDPITLSPRILTAFQTARQARFEYGETPRKKKAKS